MVQHIALTQGAFGDAKAGELSGRPVQPDGDVAQLHRLTGSHTQHQRGFLALTHIGADAAAVVTQRLQRLFRLTLRDPAVAQQLARVTVAQVANVVLDIFPERPVLGLDANVEFSGAGMDAAQHHECGYQRADSVRFAHGQRC